MAVVDCPTTDRRNKTYWIDLPYLRKCQRGSCASCQLRRQLVPVRSVLDLAGGHRSPR